MEKEETDKKISAKKSETEPDVVKKYDDNYINLDNDKKDNKGLIEQERNLNNNDEVLNINNSKNSKK